MKKIGISIFLILVILLNGTIVNAAKFQSLGMSVDLPEDYYDLKAGIDTNDSKIEFYTAMMQTTKEDLAREYKQNSTLYNGISSNLSKEIYISETNNKLTKSIFHLNLATEEQLEEVEDEISELAKTQGMYVTTQEIYKLGDVIFIHSIIENTTLTIYQYYTIVNGIGITFSLNSSDLDAKNAELKEIIDSITFDNIDEKPTEIKAYIVIGVTAVLVIMVIVLMFMAFSNKREDDYAEEYNKDNNDN